MTSRREPLFRREARTIEELLGLTVYSLVAVERRSNQDYALVIRGQRVGDRWMRVIRIPEKKVNGYVRRSATARPRDVRHRQRANARQMAFYLFNLAGFVPVVERALRHGDLDGIAELRACLIVLAGEGSPEDWLERWAEESAA